MSFLIKLTDEPLCINEAYNFVTSQYCGAIDIFIGTVRNNNEQKQVTSLNYEIHPHLTKKKLEELASNVINSSPHKENLKIYISHAYGQQNIGDISVIIAVSTPHSVNAFHICQQTLQKLKSIVPIWKLEQYDDNTQKWLGGNSLSASENLI